MKTKTVKVPGSCGELVQGIIDDTNLLISCPIDIYSKVTVKLVDNNKNKINIKDIKNLNKSFKKSKKAISKILKYYQKKHLKVDVEINSSLPIGKGMGSSTADMVGAIAGVMKALNYGINLEIIKEIILSIEPSDGTFLSGINLFAHRSGVIQKYLGEPPSLNILIFSSPGIVDTVNFNEQQDLLEIKKKKETYVRKAINLIKMGIKTGDKELLGRGSTISSKAHQNVITKPYLDRILTTINNFSGVYGINIAHSGTVMGILVEPDSNYDLLVKNIIKENPSLKYITKAKLISGGIEFIKN